MKAIKSYGYTVKAPKRMLKEVKKNMQDKRCCINWFNFFVGDMFYTDNGNYRVNIADFVIYDFSKETNIFDSQKDEDMPTEIEDMDVISWNLNDGENRIELNVDSDNE